jgi:hypothetical protein
VCQSDEQEPVGQDSHMLGCQARWARCQARLVFRPGKQDEQGEHSENSSWTNWQSVKTGLSC